MDFFDPVFKILYDLDILGLWLERILWAMIILAALGPTLLGAGWLLDRRARRRQRPSARSAAPAPSLQSAGPAA